MRLFIIQVRPNSQSEVIVHVSDSQGESTVPAVRVRAKTEAAAYSRVKDMDLEPVSIIRRGNYYD